MNGQLYPNSVKKKRLVAFKTNDRIRKHQKEKPPSSEDYDTEICGSDLDSEMNLTTTIDSEDSTDSEVFDYKITYTL